jgi:hypothetical protein
VLLAESRPGWERFGETGQVDLFLGRFERDLDSWRSGRRAARFANARVWRFSGTLTGFREAQQFTPARGVAAHSAFVLAALDLSRLFHAAETTRV